MRSSVPSTTHRPRRKSGWSSAMSTLTGVPGLLAAAGLSLTVGASISAARPAEAIGAERACG
jgi:hypothetical protein